MKGVITIFVLPSEIEDLAVTLHNLRRNAVFLSGAVQYRVEVTVCLSNELTDWEATKLPITYFADRARELCAKLLTWCEYDCLIERGKEILGCVSQRRASLYRNPDAEFFIWLDCDLFFPDDTLRSLEDAYLKHLSDDAWIIVTPEVVRQWDETWDAITNEAFLSKPLSYYQTNDTILDCLTARPPRGTRICSTFKLAGGWFSLISGKLLRRIGLSEKLGHYGMEDSVLTAMTGYMKRLGMNAFQVLVENLIVGEMRAFRCNDSVKKYVAAKDRREEFRQIACANWNEVICAGVATFGEYVPPKEGES